MATITAIHARQILDSRGNPTVEVEVRLSDGTLGRAAVPSGASTGTHEAIELRDHDPNFCGGLSVLNAVANVQNRIAPVLLGVDATDQPTVDRKMIEHDGTENLRELGANAVLGVSLAVARAAAQSLGKPLYRYIASLIENLICLCCPSSRRCDKPLLPIPMMNVLNGGRHAANGISIQEFMIVPLGFPTFRERLWAGAAVFHALRTILLERGESTGVGDEGGFAPNLPNNETALDRLAQAVERAGFQLGDQFGFALDCAATEFYTPTTLLGDSAASLPMSVVHTGDTLPPQSPMGVVHHTLSHRYILDGRSLETAELIDRLETWCNRYPILSIEDGCAEDDFDGWKQLTRRFESRTYTDGKTPILLVGDDLFVTNPHRLQQGIDAKIANAILIKPNQIGTLTQTLETMSLARQHRYQTIVSHRSGETEDTFIADLTVGTGAGWIKTGSLCRGERIAKYNQLLRIEN